MPDVAGQIDAFLKSYGSPMAGMGSVFVAAGKKYGVDPRLPVAISVAESSAGKHILGSYNAWGWGPGIPFGSWQEGISTVTKGLSSGYIGQGLKTPNQIANKYSPASAGNDPTHWAGIVSSTMQKLGASPLAAPSVQTTPAPAVGTKLVAPPQQPTSDDLQQLIDQYSMPVAPSTYGLQNALFENLGQIAQTGHTSGESSLSNMLSGQLMDQNIDLQNAAQQSQMLGLLKSLQNAQPADSTGTPSTPQTRDEPNKTVNQVKSSTFSTTSGQPVPTSVLTSVGPEHETLGLAGYPAHDYFAPAGSPAVAPVSGTVSRLSGHPPSQGPTEGPHGPFGWSVYIQGDNGSSYYLTHLGSRNVQVGEKVSLGQQIGTVGNYAKYGTPSHIHLGVRP